MNHLLSSLSFLLCLLLTVQPGHTEEKLPSKKMIHHNIQVNLNPDNHTIKVIDLITVPDYLLPEFHFFLHSGLSPRSSTSGVLISPAGKEMKNVPIERYIVKVSPGIKNIMIEYEGTINHPLKPGGKEYSRGFMETPGLISADGVYLGRSSYWYPSIEGTMHTFTLDVQTPAKWEAVSQGERTFYQTGEDGVHVKWDSPNPQDEIFLIAAKFTQYQKNSGPLNAMVFLRQPDEKLADSYLDATVKYLKMYEELIGPYPYKKFALVENFWETGYGMPSFTLMGSKIIRFPFILHSSFPHEILHNWWGNSVFTDYNSGNWSEGLTAYLSDHLIKEQRGNSASYRQTTLQKYADYVSEGKDFPLTEFTSRRSSSSEAVGYGKVLMFFHMIRKQLGDDIFKKGVQHFYKNNIYRHASFSDLQESFEKVSGKELDFDQWITRAGAPELKLEYASSEKTEKGFALTARILQVQKGAAYKLQIPLAITLEGQKEAYQTVMEMKDNTLNVKLDLPAKPVRIDVDPEFDIFRRLDRDEVPPAISQALGSKKMLILLPSAADKRVIEAYRELAVSIGNSGPDEVEIKLDSSLESLPSNMTVTILGWKNRFGKELFDALSSYGVTVNSSTVKLGKKNLDKAGHSVVFTTHQPKDNTMTMTFIASSPVEAMPGLARKLPHYHKYSYLAFEGNEPVNIEKGRWLALNSPMTSFLQAHEEASPERGKLSPTKPLALLPPSFSEKSIMENIRFLSSGELKGRGRGSEGLNVAAEFIAEKFRKAGLKPAGDEAGSYFQNWNESHNESDSPISMKNVIGVIPGEKPEFVGQSIVIGAHYDHLGIGLEEVREEKFRGKIHHGADDNASGVSVLIELAGFLKKTLKPDRSIVFIAFTGEETGKTGSRYYVKHQRKYPVDKCFAMINIDTVGRLGKKKMFILGANSAKAWPHIFRGAGYVTGVEIEFVQEQLNSSDHTSFQEVGVPAVQLFAGPHLDYHRPTDTVDKIDEEGLIKVASILKEAVVYLADREKPLSNKEGLIIDKHKISGKRRKTNLGTVPDFAFNGKGSRLSGVVPGSPAETAGLKEGDIIISINSREISGLKDLSSVLKSLKPGDRILIKFIRKGDLKTSEATLSER